MLLHITVQKQTKPRFIMCLVHFINSIIVSHSRWITLRCKFQFFFVFYLHHTFLFLFLFWDIISHHVSMLKDCIPPCSNHNYRFFFFTDPHRWVKKKKKKRIRMNIINRFVFAVSAERKTLTCNQCFMCTYIHDIYFAE